MQSFSAALSHVRHSAIMLESSADLLKQAGGKEGSKSDKWDF